MKKLYVLVALLGCFGLQLSWAQQKSISGTVFDETGGPPPRSYNYSRGQLTGSGHRIAFRVILCYYIQGNFVLSIKRI